MKKIIGGGFLLLLGGIIIYMVISYKSIDETIDIINEADKEVNLVSIKGVLTVIERHVLLVSSLGNIVVEPLTDIDNIGGSSVNFNGSRPSCMELYLNNYVIDNGYIVLNDYKYNLTNGKILENYEKVSTDFCKGVSND